MPRGVHASALGSGLAMSGLHARARALGDRSAPSAWERRARRALGSGPGEVHVLPRRVAWLWPQGWELGGRGRGRGPDREGREVAWASERSAVSGSGQGRTRDVSPSSDAMKGGIGRQWPRRAWSHGPRRAPPPGRRGVRRRSPPSVALPWLFPCGALGRRASSGATNVSAFCASVRGTLGQAAWASREWVPRLGKHGPQTGDSVGGAVRVSHQPRWLPRCVTR